MLPTIDKYRYLFLKLGNRRNCCREDYVYRYYRMLLSKILPNPVAIPRFYNVCEQLQFTIFRLIFFPLQQGCGFIFLQIQI